MVGMDTLLCYIRDALSGTNTRDESGHLCAKLAGTSPMKQRDVRSAYASVWYNMLGVR